MSDYIAEPNRLDTLSKKTGTHWLHRAIPGGGEISIPLLSSHSLALHILESPCEGGIRGDDLERLERLMVGLGYEVKLNGRDVQEIWED